MMSGKKYLIIDGLLCSAIYVAILAIAFYKFHAGNSAFFIAVSVIAGAYYFRLGYRSIMLIADAKTSPRVKQVEFEGTAGRIELNIFREKWYYIVGFSEKKTGLDYRKARQYICIDEAIAEKIESIELYEAVEIEYFALSKTICAVRPIQRH